MSSDNEIRNQIRQQRCAISDEQRNSATCQLTTHLSTSSLFKNSQHIAFYLPNDGEIDLTPLISIAWAYKKQCYLPVLGLRNSRKMWFAPFNPDTILIENRFSIPEPQHKRSDRLFKAQSLDMILMPLVAFDKEGHRLGMGGGFYDRTLQFMLQRQHWLKPHLIGTAYQFQQVPQLKKQSWDIPLHRIATEDGLQRFE